MMSHNSNQDKNLNEGNTDAEKRPENGVPSSETESSSHSNIDHKNDLVTALSQGTQERQSENTDDSDQTVLSFSPPLEVFAASTIEHQGLDPFESFSRSGTLRQGTQLAHFVVDKYIGGGGMGRVYLGIDQALDRKVALKVLPMQRAHDRASVARFMNEAKSAARLNHEHIAQVYFAGEQNGIPFIAFEYVQGTNVRTYVEQHGVIPLPQTINYLLQISHALAHAATHQVIHRDVKPSNILITTGGRAKLIDMGLARLLTHANVDNDLTASGVTLGTFDYISPEQARDPRNADSRSDIYSLGCTFFFMLTGRPPFSEGTVLQKLLQHQGDVPPDVRDFQPNIPVHVSQIIQKMMAKDPRARYQTASELVDDLTEVAKMIGLRPVDSGSLVWQLPLKGRFQPVLRHLPWLVPVILFFVFFILVKNGMFFASPAELNHGIVFTEMRGNSNPVIPGREDPSTNDETLVGNNNAMGNGSTAVESVFAVPLPLAMLSRGNLASLFAQPFCFETTDSDQPSLPGDDDNVKNDPRNMASAIRVQPVRAALEIEPLRANTPDLPVLSVGYHAGVSRHQVANGNVVTGSDSPIPTKLIVDPSGMMPNSYRSLTDAARAAGREATIELHSSEPIEIVHFRFTDLRVTIKSPDGSRAKLVFRPKANATFTGTFSMAALTNSNVVFENVDVEMVIPPGIDAVADRWTMFELLGLNAVELRNVVLTINNAQRDRTYRGKNAFFRCSSDVPAVYAVFPTIPGASTPIVARTSLTIRDCLIRGEASLLRCDNSLAVQVHSDNALIATNQPVFSLLDIKPSGTTSERNFISAEFRHNTIYAPTMVSWQPGAGGGTIGHSIALSLADSIVRLDRETATMADYAGGIAMLSDIGGFYSRNSTRTFYQNFMREWRIRSTQSGDTLREDPPKASPDDQRLYFDTLSWNTPYLDGTPLHDLTKNEFLLNESSERNPAIKSPDGTNVGMDPRRIPDPVRLPFQGAFIDR